MSRIVKQESVYCTLQLGEERKCFKKIWEFLSVYGIGFRNMSALKKFVFYIQFVISIVLLRKCGNFAFTNSPAKKSD